MYPINNSLPLKFSCDHCNKIYLSLIHHSQQCSPDCAKCQRPLKMLGLIELQDLTKHPLQFVKAMVKAPLHKLSTLHS